MLTALWKNFVTQAFVIIASKTSSATPTSG